MDGPCIYAPASISWVIFIHKSQTWCVKMVGIGVEPLVDNQTLKITIHKSLELEGASSSEDLTISYNMIWYDMRYDMMWYQKKQKVKLKWIVLNRKPCMWCKWY